jgi:hypothetical protein
VGWERRGGNLYYYQSEREGGRVKKCYIGSGEIAETIAHADETIRRARAAKDKRDQEEVERFGGLAEPVLGLLELAESLARADDGSGRIPSAQRTMEVETWVRQSLRLSRPVSSA